MKITIERLDDVEFDDEETCEDFQVSDTGVLMILDDKDSIIKIYAPGIWATVSIVERG